MNNERKQGESIAQWKRRLQANNRYGIYAGVLEPAIVRSDSSTIDVGRKTFGSKPNDYRVNQSSLFGQRRYNSNPSIAQKLVNNLTDKLHLTSPPTFTDGYNRELNAEVPLSESAQGQELKRIGSTALKGMTIAGTATLPFSFYYAPLATSAGLGTGIVASKATDAGMNLVENLTDKQFTPEQRTVATLLTSLPAGVKGYKWGWNAEKRAIESAMTASGGTSIPIEGLKATFRNLDKQSKKDFTKYIFTGKGKQPGEILGPKRSYFGSGVHGWGGETGHGNMIRAFLYDEPIPELHEVTGKGKYGVHDEYISKNYPHKYGKIRVYEGTDILDNPTTDTVVPIKSEGTNGDISFRTPSGNFNVDAGGHILEEGIGENGLYRRRQDIWKFQPKDYKARWAKEGIKNNFVNWGLNFVDSHGTPVITRTTWGSSQIPPSSIKNFNGHFTVPDDGVSIKIPISETSTSGKLVKEMEEIKEILYGPQYDDAPKAWLEEIFKTATDKEKVSFKNVINDYYNNKLNRKYYAK